MPDTSQLAVFRKIVEAEIARNEQQCPSADIHKEPEITPIRIKTAAEFISRIRRSSPEWLDEGRPICSWIFRGHWESDWELEPAAWRKNVVRQPLWADVEREIEGKADELNRLATVKNCDREVFRRLCLHCCFESKAVTSFALLADELGFRLPGETIPTYDPGQIVQDVPRMTLQEFAVQPVTALAQHHGTPTRLLDWTRNPLVAAFFATDEGEQNASDEIAVWAIGTSHKWRAMRPFTVARNSVGFLHAQDALFTYIVGADRHFLETGAWPKVIDCVSPNGIRKLTLSKSEVPELRRLLWAERISKAHLMPTFDNVSAALKETLSRSIPNTDPKMAND